MSRKIPIYIFSAPNSILEWGVKNKMINFLTPKQNGFDLSAADF